MRSFYSILTPAASAARHLAQALSTARSDFATQANKTHRRMAGDLDHARDDVGEAATRLSEVLDDALAAVRETAMPYREEARRFYEQHRGKKVEDVSRSNRHSILLAGSVLGIGYVVLRVWRKRRAQRAKPLPRSAKAAAPVSKAAARKRPAKRRSPSATRSSPPKDANGTSGPEPRTTTH